MREKEIERERENKKKKKKMVGPHHSHVANVTLLMLLNIFSFILLVNFVLFNVFQKISCDKRLPIVMQDLIT